MATKKNKASTKKSKPAKKATTKAKEVSPRENYLLILIRATERYVTGKGDGVDEMMTAQAARLRKELEELRSNEKVNSNS